ncbi:MAG: TolC family protein [Gemmataceae bacterium]|nr:TolC family protein [Gemmataceae bacterium]
MNHRAFRRWLSTIAVPLASSVSLSILCGCQTDEGAKVGRTALLGGTAPSEVVVAAESGLIQTGFAPAPSDAPSPSAATPDIPPSADERPIDLATALALAGADNPTIALAVEAVRASEADLLLARSLLLPSLNAGSSFNLHRGNLQSSQGIILDVDRQSLYAGAGSFAVGTGTVGIPGVRLTAHLADALYQPAAARHMVQAQRFDAAATRNTILLEVATRYLDLVSAEARLAALRQSEAEAAEVVRLTANFTKVGQGRASDEDRARSDALLLHTQVQGVEEEVAVAAANLARFLSLDPSVRLLALDRLPPMIRLVDPCEDIETLIAIALRNRPEMGAAAASIAVAEVNRRQEKARPLLPFLSVGYSAGSFGGGSDTADSRFGHFNNRTDFDALAVWSLDNLGFGNLAVQRRTRAVVGQSVANQVRVVDRVRQEVAAARALSISRLEQIEVARRQLASAESGYRLDVIRTRNLEGRPIEVLNSLNLLATARQDLIRAVIGYDQAQFQLFVALGQPPSVMPPEDGACP